MEGKFQSEVGLKCEVAEEMEETIPQEIDRGVGAEAGVKVEIMKDTFGARVRAATKLEPEKWLQLW